MSESRRAALYTLLGSLPARHAPIAAKLISARDYPTYRLETLLLDLNGQEPVPAYFISPLSAGPHPCILYNHAHGNNYLIGKAELLDGRPALHSPYGPALVEHGYSALCIDHWCFGERRGRTESATFKAMLWRGQVLWGNMLYDSLRAVDYLITRPDVQAERIGTLGISMGSTMAWWLAALDTRIRVCVDLCCLTDFEALIETQGLDEHGIYYYVPSLLQHFSAAQINALIAPRPHLALAGLYDPLTPPAGLDRIDVALQAAYAQQPDAWQLHRYPTGHFETAAMRAEVWQFLAAWL
jgi:dienelactone hydrolase